MSQKSRQVALVTRLPDQLCASSCAISDTSDLSPARMVAPSSGDESSRIIFTVRVRAVFDNADGRLIPGQFARLRMGQPKAETALPAWGALGLSGSAAAMRAGR